MEFLTGKKERKKERKSTGRGIRHTYEDCTHVG
jgi:hypothetical protein